MSNACMCDRCGKLFPLGRHDMAAAVSISQGFVDITTPSRTNFDLCNDCAAIVFRALYSEKLGPYDEGHNDIRDQLGDEELLAQLAEECIELGQAALKLRRCLDGKNPTPKTKAECINNLIEEHADVCNVFKALGWNDKAAREVIQGQKMRRWADRLAAAKQA